MKLLKKKLAQRAALADAHRSITVHRAALVALDVQKMGQRLVLSGSPLERSALLSGAGLVTGLAMNALSASEEAPQREGEVVHTEASSDEAPGDNSLDMFAASLASVGVSLVSRTVFSTVVNPYLERSGLVSGPDLAGVDKDGSA